MFSCFISPRHPVNPEMVPGPNSRACWKLLQPCSPSVIYCQRFAAEQQQWPCDLPRGMLHPGFPTKVAIVFECFRCSRMQFGTWLMIKTWVDHQRKSQGLDSREDSSGFCGIISTQEALPKCRMLIAKLHFWTATSTSFETMVQEPMVIQCELIYSWKVALCILALPACLNLAALFQLRTAELYQR